MKLVGFDSRIRLEWLDEVAFCYHKTRKTKTCVDHMYEFLARETAGHHIRKRYITIMNHLWLEVPKDVESIRDRALDMLVTNNDKGHRLAVHWGMAILTYPFFRDVVRNVGNQLRIQEEVSLGQIKRRTMETWGEGSTVQIAIEKLMGSLWQWGVLHKDRVGWYSLADKIAIKKEYQLFLLECLLYGEQGGECTMFSAITSPVLFPFNLTVQKHDLAQRFTVSRQGLDTDMISL